MSVNVFFLFSYTNEPNCTVACIERNDDIYCNPRCDLPQELQGFTVISDLRKLFLFFTEYPVHLKPDVYVKYESAYLNICVYIVGTVSVFLMLGIKINVNCFPNQNINLGILMILRIFIIFYLSIDTLFYFKCIFQRMEYSRHTRTAS